MRFEIWISVVAPSVGAEKKLNMGAQLQIILYKKPPKHFFRIARLNRLSVRTNVGPTVRFGTTATSWQFFVAPCNDVWKYFYTGAHQQYMGYKAVVQVFFSSHFWMVEVVRTNFAPIFSDFDNFLGCTYRSAT